RLRVATRGSRLAKWQAERVASLLGGDVEFVLIETTGDIDKTSDLHAIGGQGVFVKEVQHAVLDGRADLAVHSAKDLPSETPDGLVIASVPERADARDALVGARLDDIPTGGLVGTGSVRRRAQLAYARPDLMFTGLRGNIETRLRKQRDEGMDAIVVALAALERLALTGHVTEVLEPGVMLPQVAQGALAIECRADDDATRARTGAIEDRAVRRAVDAERAYLRTLGGGCDLPIGALAVVDGDEIVLDALLATPDGHSIVRTRVSGTDPDDVGETAAKHLLTQASIAPTPRPHPPPNEETNHGGLSTPVSPGETA
ncbi:MAG TPA: hydroxymethylbilane synthase, partial [Acidimicrobiia bacterium]|nr:hydroxymethylbilane synthase [Acidimicrobiia bacterium]